MQAITRGSWQAIGFLKELFRAFGLCEASNRSLVGRNKHENEVGRVCTYSLPGTLRKIDQYLKSYSVAAHLEIPDHRIGQSPFFFCLPIKTCP